MHRHSCYFPDASVNDTTHSAGAAMTVDEAWTCPTCNHTLSKPYCPECGERPLRTGDLTFRGFFGQIFQAWTSIDGPLIRSFRGLVTRPGSLTVAYIQGRRKPYALPLQLFLVVNVLFFAMQSLTGANVFSTTLDSHLQKFFWSPVAQNLVTHRLARQQTTLSLYAPVFNQAVALNAKSLIVLMVLPFAPIAVDPVLPHATSVCRPCSVFDPLLCLPSGALLHHAGGCGC
jgi:Protein of unknown function (DUF3667)